MRLASSFLPKPRPHHCSYTFFSRPYSLETQAIWPPLHPVFGHTPHLPLLPLLWASFLHHQGTQHRIFFPYQVPGNLPSTEEPLCCAVLSCSVRSNSVTPWTVGCQAPMSMGFPRKEYRNGFPCSPPGDLPNPGIKPRYPTLQWILYHLSHQWSPRILE